MGILEARQSPTSNIYHHYNDNMMASPGMYHQGSTSYFKIREKPHFEWDHHRDNNTNRTSRLQYESNSTKKGWNFSSRPGRKIHPSTGEGSNKEEHVVTVFEAANDRYRYRLREKQCLRARRKEEQEKQKKPPKLVGVGKEIFAKSNRKMKKKPDDDDGKYESITELMCQLDRDRKLEAKRKALRLLKAYRTMIC